MITRPPFECRFFGRSRWGLLQFWISSISSSSSSSQRANKKPMQPSLRGGKPYVSVFHVIDLWVFTSKYSGTPIFAAKWLQFSLWQMNLQLYIAANSPFRLVDLLKKVKHKKNDRKGFTEQAQAIGFTTVLHWIVLSWTMNKRKGQHSQEENIECCLNAAIERSFPWEDVRRSPKWMGKETDRNEEYRMNFGKSNTKLGLRDERR